VFGIQTSELVVIALIAILLFGPERVPEFFYRAGKLVSRLQRSADDLWTSLQTEMNQATKPLEDMTKEIRALGDKLGKLPDSGPHQDPDLDVDAAENGDGSVDAGTESDEPVA
jgi:sec-independent protein translocase protein TatB